MSTPDEKRAHIEALAMDAFSNEEKTISKLQLLLQQIESAPGIHSFNTSLLTCSPLLVRL